MRPLFRFLLGKTPRFYYGAPSETFHLICRNFAPSRGGERITQRRRLKRLIRDLIKFSDSEQLPRVGASESRNE